MIKKGIVALVIAIAFASPVLANTKLAYKNNNTLKEFINKRVQFPEFLKQQEKPQKVNVVFTVSEQGRINIVAINTDNYELKKYIFEKLEGAKTENVNQVISNDTYKIQLSFKVL